MEKRATLCEVCFNHYEEGVSWFKSSFVVSTQITQIESQFIRSDEVVDATEVNADGIGEGAKGEATAPPSSPEVSSVLENAPFRTRKKKASESDCRSKLLHKRYQIGRHRHKNGL
jgi:hypothetical protein